MPDRRTDAAAVPDAGDDTLRLALARAIGAHTERCSCCPTIKVYEAFGLADALLPRIREHVAADSPQRLFGRLISTAKGREILYANGIHGVERAEKAEAAIKRVRAVIAPWSHRAARRIRAALDETEATDGTR